jgi:two-component system NtrC family sensor kinase
MRFLKRISVRLFLLLAVLLVVEFGLYVSINYSVHQEHLERRTTEYAASSSGFVIRSARHAMMLNSRETLGQIISAVADQPTVEAIRIYNKSGEVVVSSHPDEVGHTVDTEAEACSTCHVEGDLRDVVPNAELARRFRAADGHRVIGFISPITNEPACSSEASCHAHPPDQRILGVLDLQLSLAQDDADLENSRFEMIRDGAMISLVTLIGVWLFISFVVRRPVRKLTASAHRMAKLDLDVEIDVHSSDEIGELARSFEHMAGELRKAQKENEEWARSLEVKVEEKALELQRAQAHLIRSEKMASLGRLSAIIAHEINNPLSGVLTYARLIARRLEGDEPIEPEQRQRLERHIEMIEREVKRCGDTVKNLLLFSRQKPEGFSSVGLRSLLERAVRLVQHRLEIGEIEVVKALGHLIAEDDDQVQCNADQVQQMMVALLVNAAEAMLDGGRLTVGLEPGEDEVRFWVSDTGPGIPIDVRERMFEPFFTTKEDGSGVGLGLAVVHGIVERHKGRIKVDTSRQGTTFTIILPRRPDELQGSPAEHEPT